MNSIGRTCDMKIVVFLQVGDYRESQCDVLDELLVGNLNKNHKIGVCVKDGEHTTIPRVYFIVSVQKLHFRVDIVCTYCFQSPFQKELYMISIGPQGRSKMGIH